MASKYLSSLNSQHRSELENTLLQQQHNKCFICEKVIDLDLHQHAIDIDHIQPLANRGKDDPSNFALTHSSCNRSKQSSDLQIARILARFEGIKETTLNELNRAPNLDDILMATTGTQYEIQVKVQDKLVQYSFPEIKDNNIYTAPIYVDYLNEFKYFFLQVPIEYIHHDEKINPRSIGSSFRKLLEEFNEGNPQLHVSLAWMHTEGEHADKKIHMFDGQHKAAAQIMLGVKQLPTRVFLDVPLDVLLHTNERAGSVLRQVAFDKSVLRSLGSSLYVDRITRYQEEHNLPSDYFSFSEQELAKFFKGEQREVKRYIIDSIRNGVTHHPENKLKEYIDFGGRRKERPLSYSSIEKTFYSFFIFQALLNTPINYRLEEGENPREIEKEQIMGLMNIVAEELLIAQFDPRTGTHQIESRLQKEDDIPEDHLRAYRMHKEEIMYNWLKCIHQIIKNYFIMQGSFINEDRLFQYRFPETLWKHIRTFLHNFKGLSCWVNKELSKTVFGGKQNYDFWHDIFETGRSPHGHEVLPQGLDIMKMIEEMEA